MASDTVPAAVPGPTDPPPSTAPAPADGEQKPGGLAGLLAPVQSPRTAFTLDPNPATNSTTSDETVSGISSTAFGTDTAPGNPPESSGKSGGGKQEKSVIRAWLLAGAERWRKGGDARLKALDLRKEKAKARQVKESVTVNRTEKMAGGSTNSSTGSNSGGGKSLNSKASKGPNGSGSGSKNSGPKNRGGSTTPSDGSRSSGGRGTSGKDHPSRPTSGPKNSDSDRGSKSKDRPGPGRQHTGGTSNGGGKPDPRKPSNSGNGTGGSGGGAGKPGAQGPAGKPGQDSGSPKPTRTEKKDQAKPTTPTSGPSLKKPTGPGSQPGPASTGDSGKSYKQAGPTKTPGPNAATPKAPHTSPKPAPAAAPGTLGKGLWKSHFSRKPNISPNKGRGKDVHANPKPHAKSPAGQTPTPRINLQTSREAGYRDGSRAAKAAAHGRAWRDGARDGYRDTTEAAKRETARLDKAHTDRKNTRTPEAPTVPQPTGQTIPPKPTHTPGPQPVTVTSINGPTLHLGTGASRPTISRGEVRTLRNFQHRLDTKKDRMATVAEATRSLEQHALEQLKQIVQLIEQARTVKGGAKLVAALTKLADQAKIQADKAQDIHRRAVRSSEACTVLSANADTRYGGIYQAVKDSPETSPAEMAYYRDMEATHA